MPDDEERKLDSPWVEPNITTHDSKIWGIILGTMAVIFAIASLYSGVFNGTGLAALLFATGAIAAFWEGSK